MIFNCLKSRKKENCGLLIFNCLKGRKTEKFEDTKETRRETDNTMVNKGAKTKRDRQYNGQQRDKDEERQTIQWSSKRRSSNDPQNTTRKSKDWTAPCPLITGGDSFYEIPLITGDDSSYEIPLITGGDSSYEIPLITGGDSCYEIIIHNYSSYVFYKSNVTNRTLLIHLLFLCQLKQYFSMSKLY